MYRIISILRTSGLVVLLISIVVALDDGIPRRRGEVHFCYEDEKCGPSSPLWDVKCKTGQRQSPINLPLMSDASAKAVTLDFNDKYHSKGFSIHNNGHTIQINLLPGGAPAQLSGYGFDVPYTFEQMHFHWDRNNNVGSEHSMNSTHYPIEVHLVHFSQKYLSFKVAVQSKDPKALAVLGIFLYPGTQTNAIHDLDVIASNIPENLQKNDAKDKLNLQGLLPQAGARFYRYSGSLTTPPCSESVEWIVIKKPVYVGSKLIEQFRASTIKMNVRPLQGVNNRKIEYLIIDSEIVFFAKGSGSNRVNLDFNIIWLIVAVVLYK